MSRWLRAPWRLAAAVLQGAYGVGLTLWVFPRLDAAGRHRHIAAWSRGMLRRLGVELRVDGTFRPGAKLVVANHVSWLDIMAIHAVCPEARFVSKADVRQWPLANRLVDAADTIYIERERRRDAMRVMHQIAEALAAGQTVAAFPEGTTGEGRELLPFHANLLQAAVATGAPVQPVALRYADAREPFSPDVVWGPGESLLANLWKIAGAGGLVVHVRALPAQASAHADRRALSARLREQIADALSAE